jgi:predicted thioesterase
MERAVREMVRTYMAANKRSLVVGTQVAHLLAAAAVGSNNTKRMSNSSIDYDLVSLFVLQYQGINSHLKISNFVK